MGHERSLSRALAACLERRGALDRSVAEPQHPDCAPQLGPLLTTAAYLTRALEPAPDPPRKLQMSRARLLAAAANPPRRRTPRWRQWPAARLRLADKLLAAVITVLILFAPLSRQMVSAARDSGPGHLLYPLKLHVERVQFSGAEQPDIRIALGLAFLGERVAEVQPLIEAEATIDHALLVEVQQLIDQLLYAVADTSEPMMEESLRYVALQLQAYLATLETLKEATTPSNAGDLQRIIRACRRGHRVTYYALLDLSAFRQAYRAGRPERFLLPGESPLGSIYGAPADFYALIKPWENRL